MMQRIRQIGAHELYAERAHGAHLDILDVRTEAEYLSGHMPGARWVPLDRLTVDAALEELSPQAGRQAPLYVTCQTGPRAEQAASMLRQAGLDNVSTVYGGTHGWAQHGYPLVTGPEPDYDFDEEVA
jgi:rhodanese-related sulfurtransferase